MKTWLLGLLPRLQSVQLDEQDDVRLRLGLEVSSKAVGRGSLVLRGLSVLLSFLEEVRLVLLDPPFCYSGLAIRARQARRRMIERLDVPIPIHV